MLFINSFIDNPNKSPFCVDLCTRGFSHINEQDQFLLQDAHSVTSVGSECITNINPKCIAVLLQGSVLNCTISNEFLFGLARGYLGHISLKDFFFCAVQMSVLTECSRTFLAFLGCLAIFMVDPVASLNLPKTSDLQRADIKFSKVKF